MILNLPSSINTSSYLKG